MKGFYKLPLNCRGMMQLEPLSHCTIRDSIRQLIHLVVKTHFKENRFDNAFGSILWEKDFNVISDTSSWQEAIVQDCKKSFKTYEQRLTQIVIKVDLSEYEMMDPITNHVIEKRKMITIFLEGTIKKTNELIEHSETIYFSPLSMI